MTVSAASLRLSVALVLYSVATTQTAPLLAAFRERTRPQPPTLVGVLPFSNLTGQPADDWMGVGIAETIANGRGSTISSTSVPRFRTARMTMTWMPSPSSWCDGSGRSGS